MHDDEKRINGTHVLLAFLAGAAAGAAVALLTAPRSGAATRQWLRDLAGHRAERAADGGRGAYGSAASAARDAFTRAFHRERAH